MGHSAVIRPLQDRVAGLIGLHCPGRSGRRPVTLDCTADSPLLLSYIRQLRSKKRDCYPDPQRAWDVGRELSRASGKRWLNPIVFLFACGHYRETARLFGLVQRNVITIDLLRELARTLPQAVDVSNPSQTSFADVADDLAKREAYDWDVAMNPTESYARRVWNIERATYEAFLEAWRGRTLAHDVGPDLDALLNACLLIESHATYPVPQRDYHVALLLTDWLQQPPLQRTGVS